MLDEVFQTDARLFVNTATGRFLRKDLPLLRSCCYHLLADSSAKVYFADPDNESFAVHEESYVCSLIRLAVIGGYYAAAGEQGPVASTLLSEGIKTRSLAEAIHFNNWENPGFLSFAVESAGEAMLIFVTDGKVDIIFKTRMEEGSFDDQVRVEEEEGPFEQVKSLGGRALFLGDSRCCPSMHISLPPLITTAYATRKDATWSTSTGHLEVETWSTIGIRTWIG